MAILSQVPGCFQWQPTAAVPQAACGVWGEEVKLHSEPTSYSFCQDLPRQGRKRNEPRLGNPREILISHPLYSSHPCWGCPHTKTKGNALMGFLTAALTPQYECGWWLTFSS